MAEKAGIEPARPPVVGRPLSKRLPSPAVGWLLHEMTREIKCAGQDSNLRCPKATGLQPAAIAAMRPTREPHA